MQKFIFTFRPNAVISRFCRRQVLIFGNLYLYLTEIKVLPKAGSYFRKFIFIPYRNQGSAEGRFLFSEIYIYTLPKSRFCRRQVLIFGNLYLYLTEIKVLPKAGSYFRKFIFIPYRNQGSAEGRFL